MTTLMTSAAPVPPRNLNAQPPWKLVLPQGGYVSSTEAFAAALGIPGAVLLELGTLPGGVDAHHIAALRFLIANGEVWKTHFGWKRPLEGALRKHFADDARVQDGLAAADALLTRIRLLRESLAPSDHAWFERHLANGIVRNLEQRAFEDDDFLKFLVLEQDGTGLREKAAEFLRFSAPGLYRTQPVVLDLLYAVTHKLDGYPATTVSAGQLKYVLVADKGEMGVRATREAVAMGKVPVVLHSLQDDANALQVRLAREAGGFTVGLEGNFRESYANHTQITERTKVVFQERFGAKAAAELARTGLYPGYGPLAENAAAIRHFRRENVVFIGPMQDVVENAGDKRKFRQMAQAFDPSAVTPGIIIDSNDPAEIETDIQQAAAAGHFTFPGHRPRCSCTGISETGPQPPRFPRRRNEPGRFA